MFKIKANGSGLVKADLLKKAKRELMYHINDLTLDNLEKSQELIQSYFSFLSSMRLLPDEVVPKPKRKTFTGAVNPVEKLSEKDIVEKEVVTRHRFEQKLRGGFFPTIDNGYLISERHMREMGLKHNDICIIKDASRQPYTFEIVEQGEGKPSNREQFNFCLVEWTRGEFRVTRTYTKDLITFDGRNYSFKITEKDVMDYNIKDGDIVDIALYTNNPEFVKVLTVHSIPKVESKKEVVSSKRTKAKESIDVSEETLPVDYDLLKGKTVVVVGSEHSTLSYQRAFKKLDDVKLVHLTGDETPRRFEAAVKKADIVVCSTEHVGHSGSGNARELAKKWAKPYAQTNRDGAQHLIMEAEKALKSDQRQAVGV